jgi:broad specificity phosphatase PhoE
MVTVIHPVYVVRHGESTWNVLGIMQGQIAHPALTARGREQSRDAARLLVSMIGPDRPVLVTTSDLRRAVQTAEILAGQIQAHVSVDNRLRERCLGEHEGAARTHVTARLDSLAFDEPPLGGESEAQVAHRVMSCLQGLDRSMVNIVVTHGEVLRALDGTAASAGPAGGRTVPNGHVWQMPYSRRSADAPPAGRPRDDEVR